jgi:hypothetical protein
VRPSSRAASRACLDGLVLLGHLLFADLVELGGFRLHGVVVTARVRPLLVLAGVVPPVRDLLFGGHLRDRRVRREPPVGLPAALAVGVAGAGVVVLLALGQQERRAG